MVFETRTRFKTFVDVVLMIVRACDHRSFRQWPPEMKLPFRIEFVNHCRRTTDTRTTMSQTFSRPDNREESVYEYVSSVSGGVAASTSCVRHSFVGTKSNQTTTLSSYTRGLKIRVETITRCLVRSACDAILSTNLH